eukprot:c670_g1_i1.p1 GENE.c670_g1_i1~~c670_g1_i1.p1  ORF type:complete len:285 (-),score=65.91 c670_g1_i1:42-860(-)
MEDVDEVIAAHKEGLETLRSHFPGTSRMYGVMDDEFLVRFLIATTTSEAVRRVREMLAWREANQINDIARRIIEEGLRPEGFPHYADVTSRMSLSVWYGYTSTGLPMNFEKIGGVDANEMFKVVSPDQLRQFMLHRLEYVRVILHQQTVATRKLARWCRILDVGGISFSSINRTLVSTIKKFASEMQNHYRECIGHMIVINVNAVFIGVFKVVSVVMNSRMREKVQLHGKHYQEHLEALIAEEDRPSFMGGQRSLTSNMQLELDPKVWENSS